MESNTMGFHFSYPWQDNVGDSDDALGGKYDMLTWLRTTFTIYQHAPVLTLCKCRGTRQNCNYRQLSEVRLFPLSEKTTRQTANNVLVT